MEVPQLVDVVGHEVLIFSCGQEGLSPRRMAESASGGSYYLVIDDDPTSSERAVPMDLPGLYACRVVTDRAGEPNVIGFVNRGEDGEFAGTITDPISLRTAAPALFC